MSMTLDEYVERLRLVIDPPTDLPGFSHVNGLWWYDAPIPHRWHRCRPWTTSRVDGIERCACGALRFISGPGSGLWGEKNSRTRKSR